jgi:hypothetical protein
VLIPAACPPGALLPVPEATADKPFKVLRVVDSQVSEAQWEFQVEHHPGPSDSEADSEPEPESKKTSRHKSESHPEPAESQRLAVREEDDAAPREATGLLRLLRLRGTPPSSKNCSWSAFRWSLSATSASQTSLSPAAKFQRLISSSECTHWRAHFKNVRNLITQANKKAPGHLSQVASEKFASTSTSPFAPTLALPQSSARRLIVRSW